MSALSHAGCAAALPPNGKEFPKRHSKSFPKHVSGRTLQNPQSTFLTFVITHKIKQGTRCIRFSKARPAPAARPPVSQRWVLRPPRSVILKWGKTEELRASNLFFFPPREIYGSFRNLQRL